MREVLLWLAGRLLVALMLLCWPVVWAVNALAWRATKAQDALEVALLMASVNRKVLANQKRRKTR